MIGFSSSEEMERPWVAHYEKEVPLDLAVPSITLGDLLQRTAREHGANVATLFYGERLTYAQLGEQARRFSAALARLGVEKGARVAILLPNSPQFIVALFGVLGAGGVAVPLNPASTAQELARALGDSGASVVVALTTATASLREAARGADTALEHLILSGLQDYLSPVMSLVLRVRERREAAPAASDEEDTESDIRRHTFIEMVRQQEPATDSDPDPSVPPIEQDDTALILNTEGVTGTPRGVELAHRNVLANICQLGAWVWDSRPERRDTYLSAVPFHSGYGLVSGLGLPVWVAATLVLLPRPTPKELVRSLARCRPTVFPATPPLLEGLATHPLAQRHDLRSIRVCLSSGADLSPDTARAMEELTGARVVEAYGLAEAVALTHCNPVYGERRGGSVGLPLPLTDARIFDPKGGEDMPAGEVGELAVRGPQVTKGLVEEKAGVEREGWLRTGDLARRDEDGYFYIVSRRSDVIVVGDQVVYPREVEAALLGNDKVEAALVVGAPHPRKEGATLVTAYVVLKDDADATEQELTRHCADHLPAYAVPTRIEFVEDLPRTASGNYLRRVLSFEF